MSRTVGTTAQGAGAVSGRIGAAAIALGAVAAFLAILGLAWTGPLGSDDALYWGAASGWLAQFPFVGTSHWALRHTLVVPLAAARLVLGDGLPALVAPTLLAALGLVLVLVTWAGRVADARAMVPVAALVVTSPLLVLLSGSACIDPVEMLFVFGAFALLVRAFGAGPTWGRLLPVGMLLGLAAMSRETTLFALAALGLLFLAGYGMARRWYLVVGVGFLVVAGAETAFYWATTGDPLYRATISAHHDGTIDRWIPQGAGIPLVHPLADPAVMLLLSHYFGLSFWIGPPLAVWLVRRGRIPAALRQTAVVLGVLSLTWAACAAGLWRLLPLTPRYYALPALGVAMLAGLAVGVLWRDGRRRMAGAVAALLLAGNLAGLAAENRAFMFGERVLTELAATTAEVIHTDPKTRNRAALLLELEGVPGRRVAAGMPAPGGLFFLNAGRAEPGFRPGVDWIVLARRRPPETWLQRLAPGLPLPAWIAEKLRGHPGAVLYRAS